MQYVLTEKEYQNLVPLSDAVARDRVLNDARIFILMHAKFTCIHMEDTKHGHYCDECPIIKCFQQYEDRNLICQLSKNFSK